MLFILKEILSVGKTGAIRAGGGISKSDDELKILLHMYVAG